MAEMSYGSIEDLAYTILTPYNKIPLEKSIHAAHELIHVVLCSEGYETINNIDSNSRLHKMINDMVYDPLVNKRLMLYGYDLESYLKKSDEVQIGMPRIGDNIQLVKTLCVKRILDYRNLNSEITEDDIEFIRWAKRYYPDVIEDSRKILNIIDTTGISNPSEVKEVFKRVISYLGFQNKLFI